MAAPLKIDRSQWMKSGDGSIWSLSHATAGVTRDSVRIQWIVRDIAHMMEFNLKIMKGSMGFTRMEPT